MVPIHKEFTCNFRCTRDRESGFSIKGAATRAQCRCVDGYCAYTTWHGHSLGRGQAWIGEGVESEKGREDWRERAAPESSRSGVLDILNFHLGHDHPDLFRPIDTIAGRSFRWETRRMISWGRDEGREKNGKFRWTLVERG